MNVFEKMGKNLWGIVLIGTTSPLRGLTPITLTGKRLQTALRT